MPHNTGFATASASYIVCRNLVCECFANDGFNMHGDCRGIYLENVVARYNGDDGISIHETGGLVVRGAHVHHNTFGLQDVNAARSFYNGVLAEHNPLDGAGDFAVATVFATSSQDLRGDSDTNWFNTTGLVDASLAGLKDDWGLAINGQGQVVAGLRS